MNKTLSKVTIEKLNKSDFFDQMHDLLLTVIYDENQNQEEVDKLAHSIDYMINDLNTLLKGKINVVPNFTDCVNDARNVDMDE